MSLHEPWKRDAPAGLSYLLGMLGLNLAWEIAQLPLYTIWTKASGAAAAWAVAHCTLGDVVIAGSVLFVAWIVAGRPTLRAGIPLNVATLAICLGLAFAIFSEWRATQVSHSWEYSSWMPVIPVLQVGLTPVVQWIVLPPIAMQFAFGMRNRLSPRRL